MLGLGTGWLALVVATGCGGASGAKGGKGAKRGKGKPAQPLAVELESLAPATIERHYRASGTLEPLRHAQIRPVRAGIIEQLEVEVGDVVEAEQVLARLDGRELSLQAKRDRVDANNVKAELERLRGLDGTGAIAQEEIDARRYELQSAKATARLSRAQASTMTVRAPFAGTVIAREVDVGNLAGTSTVIYEVADLSAIELPLHLPEREAARVSVGNSVEIELIDGSTFAGTVIRRAPIVDALTGTVEFLVRAKEFPALAVPGAFVRARVLLERHERAASLNAHAVFELEGKRYVYVLRDGKARRVAVEVGLEGSERIEILSGLSPDDRVMSDANGITEGLPIKPAGEPTVEPQGVDAGDQERGASGDRKGH